MTQTPAEITQELEALAQEEKALTSEASELLIAIADGNKEAVQRRSLISQVLQSLPIKRQRLVEKLEQVRESLVLEKFELACKGYPEFVQRTHELEQVLAEVKAAAEQQIALATEAFETAQWEQYQAWQLAKSAHYPLPESTDGLERQWKAYRGCADIAERYGIDRVAPPKGRKPNAG